MDNVEKDAITMVAAIVCAALLVGTALVLYFCYEGRGDRRFKQGGTRGNTMIKIERASALSRLTQAVFPIQKTEEYFGLLTMPGKRPQQVQ